MLLGALLPCWAIPVQSQFRFSCTGAAWGTQPRAQEGRLSWDCCAQSLLYPVPAVPSLCPVYAQFVPSLCPVPSCRSCWELRVKRTKGLPTGPVSGFPPAKVSGTKNGSEAPNPELPVASTFHFSWYFSVSTAGSWLEQINANRHSQLPMDFGNCSEWEAGSCFPLNLSCGSEMGKQPSARSSFQSVFSDFKGPNFFVFIFMILLVLL